MLADLEATLVRLTRLHERTGCVADRADDAVLATAKNAPAGPLHGEPVTVKDWIDVVGFRCSGGDVEHAERRPERDATVVARLRAAGAVVVAKTAVLVDSERFGPVRHPHDPARSPGGSSSGEGVVVGGGVVRLGIGSDSGGSVRVPAAWCGVVGFKPSVGLVPNTGHFPRLGDRVDGRTVIGPLSASVEMAWRALTVMAGPDGHDGGVAPVVLGDPRAVDVAGLRISVGVPGGARVAPEVSRALDVAAGVVSAAGAAIGPEPPDWLDEARRISEAYWARAERTGAQVEEDLADWDRFRSQSMRSMRGVDVLVVPTVTEMAPLHRTMRTDDYVHCLPVSLLGAPAVSVPVGDGAVQVIAHRWRDHLAAAVAGLLERSAV